jgi:transglycosylase-like protein with SLT domain
MAPSPATAAPPSPAPTPTTEPSVVLPQPDQPIPNDPAALADALAETTDLLHSAIDDWTDHGDPSKGQPPDDVVLLSMYQQRMYRELGRDQKLADETIPLLPKRLRGEARADAGAVADLVSLVTAPVKDVGSFRTGKAEPAGVLRSWFKEGERRFGVRWELLAAVMFIESKFGKVKATSSAGAQGPMQFIPSTWAGYGMGGDIHDPHDAILAAANYLHASGAPQYERRALYAYNHAWPYVDAVLAYANQMAGDERDYYAYYSWQVYVLTTNGVVRLTGPGR